MLKLCNSLTKFYNRVNILNLKSFGSLWWSSKGSVSTFGWRSFYYNVKKPQNIIWIVGVVWRERGNCLGAVIVNGSCLGGICQEAIALGRNFQRRNSPGGNYLEVNCPGGSYSKIDCPRTQIYLVIQFYWQFPMTSFGFWFVNILLQKFDISLKKSYKKNFFLMKNKNKKTKMPKKVYVNIKQQFLLWTCPTNLYVTCYKL